jgi:alanine racemase
MDDTAKRLLQPSRSIIEISRSALHHNIAILKRLSSSSELAIVVKSNAYGHGMMSVALELEHNAHVTWLCTVGIQEAVALRQAGSTKRLLSMAYNDAPIGEALEHSIDLTIDDESLIALYHEEAARVKRLLKVHIKIDTGLTRLGVAPEAAVKLIKKIKTDYPWLDVFGVFTHLADTNNIDQSYTHYQLSLFDGILEELKRNGMVIPCTHALSSGGLTLPFNPQNSVQQPAERLQKKSPYEYSLVRLGTNVYGLYKSDIQRQRLHAYDPTISLKPVLSWKSSIVHIDTASGQFSSETRRSAFIPVGYADGYPTILAQKAHVMIRGKQAKVVQVNADRLSIDVTDLPEVGIQDSAVLIGDSVSAHDNAYHAQTINNELLTRLNPDIKRILVD